jgi:hypothetical protein
MSLAELGKFAEATKYKAEAIQLAEQTQHVHTIGWAHLAASVLDLSKGDWVEARSLVDHWMSVPGMAADTGRQTATVRLDKSLKTVKFVN